MKNLKNNIMKLFATSQKLRHFWGTDIFLPARHRYARSLAGGLKNSCEAPRQSCSQDSQNVLTSVMLVVIIFVLPIFVFAEINPFVPPCDDNCGYEDLFVLINNIIDWVIYIIMPLSAGIFAWAGILYIITPIADKKSEAKKIMQNVFWGLVIILSAWIIVSTIMNVLLKDEFKTDSPVDGVQQGRTF